MYLEEDRRQLEKEVRRLRGERDRLAAALSEARRDSILVANSWSWRLTRPLREVPKGVTDRLFSAYTSRKFIQNLCLLHDTLDDTELAGRYWLSSGLLLGWARNGKPLKNDMRDADIYFLSDDLPSFARAIPSIIDAGFEPSRRLLTNDGRTMVYQFILDGSTFDFAVMEQGDGYLHYYSFRAPFGGTHVQVLDSIPDQPLEPFEFVGRTWLKHIDHDAELTAMYGDWRIDDPRWDTLKSPAIIERSIWTRFDESVWTGQYGDTDNERMD
jgi:hypothetical protein